MAGAEPLVPLAVYGDGIGIVRRAYKTTLSSNVACPVHAIESAHRSSAAKEPLTPITADLATKIRHQDNPRC